MCFAPQRRALFRHLNFQKWSDHGVFCTFWLRNNCVQFFISPLASWLRTRRFSEPTFRPSGAPNHWEKQSFVTFLPFHASASSFFLYSFSSTLLSSNISLLPLPCSAFHLSILSEVWLLNFLRLFVIFISSGIFIYHHDTYPRLNIPDIMINIPENNILPMIGISSW